MNAAFSDLIPAKFSLLFIYLKLVGFLKHIITKILRSGEIMLQINHLDESHWDISVMWFKISPSLGKFPAQVVWWRFLFNSFQTEVDIVEDIEEYQTWPGWLIIVFRSLIMIWFLYELRTTMLYEHNTQKLNFLLHFGASSLVWFIYLPMLALIALHVSALWRFKLLLGELIGFNFLKETKLLISFLSGITYSADCFAYCVMAHLLWPTRSEQYFLLKGPSSAELEELDEFNEAPHIVNNSYTSMSSINSYDICKYDDAQKTKLITNMNTWIIFERDR